MEATKQKHFDKVMLRIDPLLGKILAYIPVLGDQKKAIVEKNVTNNFMVMMISWLLIASRKFEKPVVINDDEGKPAYEITIKKL